MSSCSATALPYHADPAHYFKHLQHLPGAVLLDAGRPHAERGRYDLISAEPLAQLQINDDESANDFAQRLRSALASLGPASLPEHCSAPFAGGLIGFLSYDFSRHLEQLPSQASDDLCLPHARFGLYDWALISDHQTRTCHLISHPRQPDKHRQALLDLLLSNKRLPTPAPFKLLANFHNDTSQAAYAQAFADIQHYIGNGDCYQINFAQRFQAPYRGNPLTAFGLLRQACPTPFSAYLSLGADDAIVSLSPERFLKVSQGHVETRPIKGTRPRGNTEPSDQANAAELLSSRKDRAENLMIVDLLRNDLGRSCAIGSVRVPELFALESYPNVHHLVSCVTGQLAPGKDSIDLLLGSFPGGSITGAPKIRAMQIIDELEPTRRAIYCGSLLYLDVRGEMDSSIAIRTLLFKDGQVSCWGGGGIVADSDCQAEYQESLTKVDVLLRTLEQTL